MSRGRGSPLFVKVIYACASVILPILPPSHFSHTNMYSWLFMTSFTFKLSHTTGSAVKTQRFPFIFSGTPGGPATVVVVTTVATDLFIVSFWAA